MASGPGIEDGPPEAWEWETAPEARAYLPEILARWETLEQTPGARIVKQNIARTVIALPASSRHPGLIVKRYHVRGWFERAKYLFLPSRARAEWEALQHYGRQALPGPFPLAVGEVRRGGILERAGLVMEFLPGTEPLTTWLERHGSEGDLRDRLLGDVGLAVARMHESGVDHGDLHAGNVLVQDFVAGPRVYIIDLHGCRLGGVLPEVERRRQLARLVHSLGELIDYGEGLALLEGYATGSPQLGWVDSERSHVLRDLQRRATKLEWTRLSSRSRRCWKNSSDFTRGRIGAWWCNRRREIPRDALRTLIDGELHLDPIFKERPGHRVGVTTLQLDAGPTPVVVKIRKHRTIWKRVAIRCGLLGPLEAAWWAARALEVRQIPTPRALALLRRSRGGLPAESILITEYHADAVNLREDLLDRYYPRYRADKLELAERERVLAALVRRLHDTGLYHRDLNPMNLLVVPGDAETGDGHEFQLVDLDSIRPGQRLSRRRRQKNLVQLALAPEGHLRPLDRLRFLYAYDRGEGRYFCREWIESLDRQLADEVIRIMARISAKETEHALDPEVCDPRFRAEAADLTREFETTRSGRDSGRGSGRAGNP